MSVIEAMANSSAAQTFNASQFLMQLGTQAYCLIRKMLRLGRRALTGFAMIKALPNRQECQDKLEIRGLNGVGPPK